MLESVTVRILLDYRPALRARTGVGEFVHELARALASPDRPADEHLTLLTTAGLSSELFGTRVVDRRIPVRPLAWAWNRLEWPPVEWLAGPTDVVHSQSPLLIPSAHAASLVTIHDLHFLSNPDQAEAEIRRDFPALVHSHARRADHIVVSSAYAAAEVRSRLGVQDDRITVCPPGPPRWAAEVAAARASTPPASAVLFLGTLEPRKNVGGLLDAYAALRRRVDAPPLVLAGGIRSSIQKVLARAEQPPLAGHVKVLGYVGDDQKRELFRHAAMLILPSFEEGFGLPVLEAMAAGVPVVVSNRGSLPEVSADAASPVDPDDTEAMAAEMARLLDPDAARDAARRGLARASQFSWSVCAARARQAYAAATAVKLRRTR
jgi:glycosyltransferase involved in cell wall biosynthesis